VPLFWHFVFFYFLFFKILFKELKKEVVCYVVVP